ncbi:hypothetical protein STRAU_0298 [Streptomyces aurantiacus JA 4570]|uniref:DNA-binding phage zinc finger domain-containing protein n=2 Tax=Streptomyces aurantiacus TaxID=47760 RepID=S3ZV42_9ACTN|nr:hypothetical protein [Streptomyces aurantiacus]EPH46634.1 hypothetical protein STRAU_0298 [Streptomyces aurantiacus JA 4570]
MQREHERQQVAEERKRVAEEERQRETGDRRLNLIGILSVACPHCMVPAAALCQSPQGLVVRPLHRARRQLAGVHWPKEFVVEATNIYTLRVAQPPLDADPREILGDPLEDRTPQAEQRYALEQQEEARRKLHEAQRSLWLASSPREDAISAQPCPVCHVRPQTACVHDGKRRKRPHVERVDAAMACEPRAGSQRAFSPNVSS